MNQRDRRIATTRAFKAELVKTQGEDFYFEDDDAMLTFSFKDEQGNVFTDLAYHRGQLEVFNPKMKWVDNEEGNIEHKAYQVVVDKLNAILDQIKPLIG